MKVSRFGVSLEEGLLRELDGFVKKHRFPNRSKALRHLVRNALVEEAWRDDQEVVGIIVLIFDHHRRNVVGSLVEVQHDFSGMIISSQHVHLDHDTCLEAIVLKGRPSELQRLSDRLIAIKGIKHGQLVMSGF
ncbi:MAG TPA: nickel-responsive transcriptional regulator NikR [Deltaproteobacteria bacterium]|nr:nickel-responsive transcriptional regulator NikR [Desulfomonilia bacterium]HDP25130.1 nickel-responsive transcriptional regulator NikR [Deltaproteobacteria bacterium]